MGSDKKAILLRQDATYKELFSKVRDKFQVSDFVILFRDEDGEYLRMNDDDDLFIARSSSVDENKIEIWLG